MPNQEQITNNQERSDEVLVRVDNVSKKFCKSLKRSFWYGMCDTAKELNPFAVKSSKLNVQGSDSASLPVNLQPSTCNLQPESCNHLPPLRKDEFWAVRDVSFELKRGECLGLIGHNGAGKSTLLKMLNGLIKPDTGRIEMHGRIGALIELGAGFNPILTGRENVYNKGAILGFTKKEIDKKFDEIVDFAEIDEFIDSPVQNYSSGMKVRLGFAVSAMMDPDVLIIDEVLAVGDASFRAKCYNVLGEMKDKAATIIVSHSMQQIAQTCTSGIVINKGSVAEYGEIPVAIKKYFSLIINHQKSQENNAFGKTAPSIDDYNINVEPISLQYNDKLNLELTLQSKSKKQNCSLRISFYDSQSLVMAEWNNRVHKKHININVGCNKINVIIDGIKLRPDTYKLGVVLNDDTGVGLLLWSYKEKAISVEGVPLGSCSYLL